MEDHYSEGVPNKPEGPSEALQAFFGSFGEIDLYAQIVLEEFMEALLNEK
jgi:hypothetical protein